MKQPPSFKKKILILGSLYSGLLIFLFITNPRRLSAALLLIPFVWLFIAIFMTVRLILYYRDAKSGNDAKKSWIRAVILAMLPSFLLLLASINQLTLRDIVLFGIFVVLVIFYTNKLSLQQTQMS